MAILYSNQANFHLDRWQALLGNVAAHGNQFGQAAFTDEKKRSYDDSRATNPVSQPHETPLPLATHKAHYSCSDAVVLRGTDTRI